jgi:hypothetical protein
VPITHQQVKAEIARPEHGEEIALNSNYRIHGAAWSGEAVIEKVEISFDSGRTWNAARMPGEPIQNAWRLWEYDWHAPATSGKQTILARATDSRGTVQPADRSADRGTYMINHCLPVEVDVR